MADTHGVDTVVIGAGVVGLAAARAMALRGHEVLILEKNAAFGEETSARNSEVIHAGIVYAQGSLKARACVEGKERLYSFCEERGVGYSRCGKLIVATGPQDRPALERALGQAEAAGVTDLRWLDRRNVAALEPALASDGALLSPSTGIVDSHGFMLALLGEAEAQGAQLVLNAAVTHGATLPDGRIRLTAGVSDVLHLDTAHVINCAGLWAQKTAHAIDGIAPESIPGQVLAKGSYFALNAPSPCKRLVYPAPPGDGSLGVHLTLDLAGRTKFGPDIEMLPGAKPEDVDYTVDPARGDVFYEAVRRYWPGLPDDSLVPDYAGCRPKLAAGDAGQVDFRIDGAEIHGLAGHVMCYGLESPGLTSALALGDHIADLATL